MTAQLRVLGSVTATLDGREIHLGGAQQRRLLAVLVAEADTVVALDRLVQIQLPDDLDHAVARSTVRTYVSRLRAAIGDRHVLTRDHGYSLVTEGATVDALEFEATIRRARLAAPAAALALFDEALALWAGRAYGEFAEEWWAVPDAARLEEMRLVANHERVDALLALGRHSDAVVDLERLLNANPLRERFAAQLMTALYRSGRQAEAHRVYQEFRDGLIEQTGLDPSPVLVELDRAISRGDASVGLSDHRHRGYVLSELIGRGAYGDVYRSSQPGLERDVAVKAIRSEFADRPSFIRRFEAEAQMVARIEHPHVVPLYDFWRESGAAYLVFRFLRGGSAERALVADGPWQLVDVDRLVQEIGGALVAAHAAGIVHRDVKPSNVLFDELGNAYLADFGIAIEGAESVAESSGIRGDVRAFGTMVWELLCGGQLAVADPLPSLLHLRTDVPDALLGVLDRAASQAPELGYASVAEFLVAWRTALPRSVLATTQEIDGRSDAAEALAQHQLQRVNPYKGLRAFRESDASEFFGRDRLVAELLSTVDDRRVVIVVGSSGSGKSSLVHAGLVPQLRQRPDTFVVSFTPGTRPLARMRDAVGEVIVLTHETGGGGADMAAMIRLVPEGELVIVIDQAEELWTLGPEDARRELMLGLTEAVTGPTSRVRVVMTVRADFFDRVLNDPVLGPIARGSTFGVTPMTPDELHDAVVKPAARVGVRFDDRLVTTIVSDIGSGTTGLPLLQFGLSQLYERRTSSTITTDDYERLGELGGALATRAEELFASLDERGQSAAHELFTRLVVPGDDHVNPTRRRVRISETANVPGDLIELFANDRLLAFDHDAATREPTVEVAHEALFEQWPRLRQWIEDERSWIQIRGALADASRTWDDTGRDEEELYRGARLERAIEVADEHPGSLVGAELEFLDAAIARRDRQANRARRENRRLRRSLVALAAVLVVALIAGAVALAQRRSAKQETHRAETSRLMASAGSLAVTDTPVAALLTLEASRRGDAADRELATVMQRVLTAKPHFLGAFPTVGEYLFSEDGSAVLARTAYGLEAYSVADHRLLARSDHPTQRGISGRRLASSRSGIVVETAGDSEIWRYRLPDLEPVGDPIATPGSVRALAMSPNGVLVSGQPGGLVVVWDPETGEQLREFSVDDEVFRLDINATGNRLAVATYSETRVYDLESLQPVGPAVTGTNVDVAISPDGTRLAVPHYFVTETFEVASGELIQTSAFGAGVRFVDDQRLAISIGTHLDVVDLASGAVVLEVPTTCGCDLDVSADGRMVVTGLDGPGLYSLDGRELLADPVVAPPTSRESFVRLTASRSGRTAIVSVAFGGALIYRTDGERWELIGDVPAPASAIVIDDDRMLVARGIEPVVDVVEIASGAVLSSIEVAADVAFWFEVDPSFTRIAYETFDGVVGVIDAESGAPIVELTEIRDLNRGNDAPFITFSLGPRFSDDGSRLAASTWSGAAVVWDTETWDATTLRLAGVDVNSAARPAFDPTGEFVAVSAGRRAISLFDAKTLEHRRDLPLTVQGLPTVAAFNADGSRLAVTLDTAITIVFDVATGQTIGSPLRANFLGDLRYLDDGRLAVADSFTDNLLVWNTDVEHMTSRLCALAGRNLTRAEWLDVGPRGEPYRRTCEQFAEPPADPTLSRDLPPVEIELPTALS